MTPDPDRARSARQSSRNAFFPPFNNNSLPPHQAAAADSAGPLYPMYKGK